MSPRTPQLPLTALSAICAALLASCGGTASLLNDVDLAQTLRETIPLAAQHADAGAVVLLDEGSMDVSGSSELGLSTFERHRIVRILNPRGQRYANIVVPYGSSTRVDQIQARTISPGGTVIPLLDKDIFDVSLYPNFVFFSDQRAKIFTMPAIEDGAVIEYTYRLIISNRVFWPSWTFQEDVPVVISRFKLVKPGDWDVVFRSYGTPITPTTTKVPSGFRSTHIWEARNIPPLRNEFGMPPASEVATGIAVAPLGFKTWDDIAHWYAAIVGTRNKGGSAVQAMADSLTHGATTDQEKLRRLFDWVREYVRYIAVEIGAGGYEPHHADDVFAKRYGDCKDLVMLLSALANASGIEVRPVLISTWHNGKPDTSLPSGLQFNHLIGFAPDVSPGGVWLDPTDKAGVFGTLPWYDRGTFVVVAGKGTDGYRAMTPADSAPANRTILQWDVILRADGSAIVTGATLLSGAFGLDLRNELRYADSTDVRHWLGTSLASRCPGATVLGYGITPVRQPRDTLVITYRFEVPALAVQRDSSLVIRPWAFNASQLANHFREKNRTHPIRFRYPSHSELNLTVTPPAGWHLSGSASADSIVASCGRAQWRVGGDSAKARLIMRMELQGEDLKPEDYRAFRDFLDGVRLREMRELEFVRVR